MNYTKAMIDLISEARRRAPSEDKPNIKLANPDVLSELNIIYHATNDVVIKAIIKETFHLAGGIWPDKLLEEDSNHQTEVSEGPRFITKVYRGQTQLIEIIPEEKLDNTAKSVRIYRGQIIAQ
jgi:hypothetical protein